MGADPLVAPDGLTPLHYAAGCNQKPEIITTLINIRVDPKQLTADIK